MNVISGSYAMMTDDADVVLPVLFFPVSVGIGNMSILVDDDGEKHAKKKTEYNQDVCRIFRT